MCLPGYSQSAKRLPTRGEGLDAETLVQEMAKSPKVHALHARLRLPESLPRTTLAQVLIDKSMHFPQTNAQLASLGNAVSKYLVHEFLLTRWPRLPDPVVRAAVSAYSGSASMASLVKSWGVELGVPDRNHLGKLLFRRVRSNASKTEELSYAQDAMSQMAKALVGAVYLHEGFDAAKRFVYEHMLSRHLDLKSMFAITDPVRQLARLSAREGLDTPIARMMAETGRKSSRPVYVIGIYIGGDLVGQGEGSSIREAHHRAAGNALRSWYLYETRDADVPSTTLAGNAPFKPVFVDHGDIIV